MDNYFSRYIHLALSGDSSSFETLYNLTKDRLYFMILSFAKDEGIALELMQESYITAFENLSMLTTPEYFDMWLNRIAAGSVRNFLQAYDPALFDDVGGYDLSGWDENENLENLTKETIEDRETQQVLNHIIDNLPNNLKLMVFMHYYQEMSVSTISATFELSREYVMYSLTMARQAIKAEIGRLESEGSLTHHVTISALPFVLSESAKSQFLFKPAPPFEDVIAIAPDSVGEHADSVQTLDEHDSIKERLRNIHDDSVPITASGETANPQDEEKLRTMEKLRNISITREASTTSGETSNPQDEEKLRTMEKLRNISITGEASTNSSETVNPQDEEKLRTMEKLRNISITGEASTNSSETVNPQDEEKLRTMEKLRSISITGDKSEDVEKTDCQDTQPSLTVDEKPVENVASNPQRPAQPLFDDEHGTVSSTSAKPSIEAETPTGSGGRSSSKRIYNYNSRQGSDAAPKSDLNTQTVNAPSNGRKSSFFSSIAGKATVAGLAVVIVVTAVVIFVINAAKMGSISPQPTNDSSGSAYSRSAASDDYSDESADELSKELTKEELQKDDVVNYTYKKSGRDIIITGYNGNLDEIVIPEEIDGYKVTGIGYEAFKDCTNIKSITISKYVTNVWVGVGNAVNNPFADCIYLENIFVDSNNTDYSDDDGILYNKDKTQLVAYPSGKSETSFVVPDTVKSIFYGAFNSNYALEEVTLPSGVTSIGQRAFYYCSSLKEIVIPNGVERILDGTFANCSSLASVSLPESIRSIEETAFYRCTSLENIVMPQKLEYIKSTAFMECTMLATITIPNSNTALDEGDVENLQYNSGTFYMSPVTIIAPKDSKAHQYAKKCNVNFQELK